MSDININNISLVNKIHDNNKPKSENMFSFNLEILFTDKKKLKISKKSKEKYCNLLDKDEDISFFNIKSFSLVIFNLNTKQKLVDIYEIFKIDRDFDLSYTYRNDDIYIEFYLDNNKTTCNSILKNIYNEKFKFYTPPNY